MTLQYLNVLVPKDIEAAFGAATKGRTDAIVVLAGPVLLSHRTQLAESAVKNRIPVTYQASEYVEGGGLMSYGTSFTDLSRRAAIYIDKILKGASLLSYPSSSRQSSNSS